MVGNQLQSNQPSPESPIRVLLVEDNPGDVRLLEELLQASDPPFELVVTDRLSKALEQIRHQTLDVILLDLSLPDSFGLETVTGIREQAPEIPIVVLTGTDDEELARQAVRLGVQDYLVKGDPSRQSVVRCIRYAIDRKRLEAEGLERACIEHERASLQEAVKAQEQALSVVAHELRAPLAAMRATVELLMDGEVSRPHEHADFLRSVHQEVIRMADMVNDLLEAARLNSGSARWRWGTVHLIEVCDRALESVRPLLADRAVRLSCEVDPPDLMMHGDVDAIHRLVLNLVNNALKHTASGSIGVHVHEREGARDPTVELQFRDTGAGMRPEVVARLGEPFALNSGIVGEKYLAGTGLGIAICKGIVAAHGGTMSVDSAPGRGTSITVRLRTDLTEPASHSGDVEVPSSPADREPATAEARGW